MKKLIKRIFRGKYYKNGESYVDTIVKVIICVVVGALLLTSVYAVAKSGLESAKNKVNDLLDYNPDGEDGPGGGDTSIPDGEDGPGGGDTSIPGGGDESEPEVPDLPQLAAPLIDIEGDTLSIIDEEGDADEFELYIDGEYTQDINAEPTTVFDLSVLSLEDGSHTIQCKAKAEGYQTSEFSNSVEYEVAAFAPYLTFQSVNPFTISVASPKWDGTMEYSTDTENWTAWDGSSISSVDGKVYLRGTGNTRVSATDLVNFSRFVISGTAVECVGNIETLLDWQTVVDGQHPTMNEYCFCSAFKNCSALITAPSLPATNLAEGCYIYMFNGCTSLTTAPELPATTLASYCYCEMFRGCTNLTTAPALPATTLANYCYLSMFYNCTSLTTAPALPATALADNCYRLMFVGCANLTTAPALPATTLAEGCYYGMFFGCTNLKVSATQTGTYQHEWRIPTEGTISSTPSGWSTDMFANTGGTFTGDPAINTTYYLEYMEPYLTFQSVNPFTISVASPKWDGTMEYSTDTYNWTTWNGSSISSVNGKVYLRGTGNEWVSAQSFDDYSEFVINGTNVECIGNIETLLDWQTVLNGEHPIMNEFCFAFAFRDCSALITAPALPATTLASSCYEGMFQGCTSLTTAPALPATTLAGACYRSMFYGCANLTTAPELPATTLANYCYFEMFYGCTALTTAPELPATTLADFCYRSMFYGCTNLTTAPALPATTLADDCYSDMFYDCTSLTTAPALPATTLANLCYAYMFYRCTALTTAPALPATTLAEGCYGSMFQGCTALTTAPALPATTLASGCYDGMFQGCTALTTAPALPATTLADYCYYSMFYGCTALTTAPALPATTLATRCYDGMFQGCTALTTAPALPATTLANYCYTYMFYGCTNLKVSATQTDIYQYEWRIPTEGTISSTRSGWNTTMLSDTGGTFTGNPAINTTYYLEYPPVGSEPAIPPVLEAPTNISVSGSTLIWDAVANAISYNVYKDGILFNTVATNSCDISGITEAGSYSFAVQALADGYTPSAISDVIAYEVVSEGLTGTKWQFHDDMGDLSDTGWRYYINATVYNNQHSLEIEYIELPDYDFLLLKNTYQAYEFLHEYSWKWYSGSGGASATDAPTIEITGGDDVDNPEFITWLQERATKIS